MASRGVRSKLVGGLLHSGLEIPGVERVESPGLMYCYTGWRREEGHKAREVTSA
jgi:hypothetical protein